MSPRSAGLIPTGLRPLAKRFRDKLLGRGVVLLYHRIIELPSDPQLLAVTPERFTAQLEVLVRMFEVVPLLDLITHGTRGRGAKRKAAITFDDGYSDNLHEAAGCLQDMGLSATVFVTTGAIGSREEFYWDELERILLLKRTLPPRLELAGEDGKAFVRDLGSSANATASEIQAQRSWSVTAATDPTVRHSLYRELCELFRRLPIAERETMRRQLLEWAELPREARESHRALTLEELLALASFNGIEIGAHTVNHPSLAFLEFDEQRAEIRQSREWLKSNLGVEKISGFAYPYGTYEDYTSETVSAVIESEFAYACCNRPDVVRSHAVPFQIPRLIVRNWHGDRFIKELKAFV